MSIPSWDEMYMSMAHLFGMKSKDRSTKTGCVIVNKNNRIVSLGYNGFPVGVDDEVEERHDRPAKYEFTEHSERNAIYNADVPLQDCKIYVTWFPCADCARGIIQKGITEVIIHKEFDEIGMDGRWDEAHKASKEMFKEAGVKVRAWSGNITQIKGFKNGQEINLEKLTDNSE